MITDQNHDSGTAAVKPQHDEISVIPNNSENYTSFTIGDVTFIDFMQFMMSSLDKLTKKLTDDKLKGTSRYLKSDYGGILYFCVILL